MSGKPYDLEFPKVLLQGWRTIEVLLFWATVRVLWINFDLLWELLSGFAKQAELLAIRSALRACMGHTFLRLSLRNADLPILVSCRTGVPRSGRRRPQGSSGARSS
jgi:hypothetical protein